MCGPSVALTPCNTGNDAGRLGPRRLPVAFRCQGRSGAARKSAATPLPTHQTNSTGRRSSSPTKVRSAGSTLVTRGDSVSRRARRVALTLCNEGSYAGGAVQRLLLAPDPWRQLVARVAVRSEHQSTLGTCRESHRLPCRVLVRMSPARPPTQEGSKARRQTEGSAKSPHPQMNHR